MCTGAWTHLNRIPLYHSECSLDGFALSWPFLWTAAKTILSAAVSRALWECPCAWLPNQIHTPHARLKLPSISVLSVTMLSI